MLIFEKKLLDGMERRDREVVIEMMKKGVQQLTRLRHPRLMVVQHPVEESRYIIIHNCVVKLSLQLKLKMI